MPKFLSHTWLEEAKAIRHSYAGQGGNPPHQMRMNLIITDVPEDVAEDDKAAHIDDGAIAAHMDTTGEEMDMDIGHLENPDLTVTLEFTGSGGYTVTGANGVWIAGAHSVGLPEAVLFPTITRAREVLEADGLLSDSHRLRRVIDLPADLDELDNQLTAAGAVTGAQTLLTSTARSAEKVQGANDRIRLGFVGVGNRGQPLRAAGIVDEDIDSGQL